MKRDAQPPESEARPIRVGVSSCLLGNPVRWDGGHKRDAFVTDWLGAFVEWVPVCPEVELGMGIPRPTLQLTGEGPAEGARLVEVASRADHTGAMKRYSRQRVKALREHALCGYVLKSGSPSCGMTRVRVWRKTGMAERIGQGLFAAALLKAYPELPVEEEGRLHDAKLRENFVERVFAYRRLRDLFSGRWTNGQVVAFHTAHKLQLMAHSTAAYRRLGRRVAEVGTTPRAEFRRAYEHGFMAALAVMATPGRHANTLQHAAGHLKKGLDSPGRMELDALIHDYRRGLVPLVVPVTLLRHHTRVLGIDYLSGQTYLEPHPKELMLRNHV